MKSTFQGLGELNRLAIKIQRKPIWKKDKNLTKIEVLGVLLSILRSWRNGSSRIFFGPILKDQQSFVTLRGKWAKYFHDNQFDNMPNLPNQRTKNSFTVITLMYKSFITYSNFVLQIKNISLWEPICFMTTSL